MKNSIIILCIIFYAAVYAQEKTLISISKEIGTEVDREERDQYKWFPEVPNFISARFYQLPDQTYEIQIRFFQNGQITEQNRVITPEAFYDNYKSLFEPKNKTRRINVERRRTERQKKSIINESKAVNLKLKTSTIKNIEIKGIHGDSIITVKSIQQNNTSNKIEKIYAISDIENISAIRSTNVPGIVGIGIFPGIISGLFAYTMFHNDESDRENGSRRIFYLGEIIGISITGTLAAMRSVDYEYVFSDLSNEQKKEKLNQFIDSGLRKKTNVRFSTLIGVYHFPNYLHDDILFPGMRLSICFSPRKRMEIMFAYSGGWSIKNDQVTHSYFGNTKVYDSLNLFRMGFRIDHSYNNYINPFIAWGWGFMSKQYKIHHQNYYDDLYINESDIDLDVLLNLDIGMEHHFNQWFSVESRVSLIENIDFGIHYMFQLGIHAGRFY